MHSASMGDEQAAARSVGLSETAFAEIAADIEPEWARFMDVVCLNGE